MPHTLTADNTSLRKIYHKIGEQTRGIVTNRHITRDSGIKKDLEKINSILPNALLIRDVLKYKLARHDTPSVEVLIEILLSAKSNLYMLASLPVDYNLYDTYEEIVTILKTYIEKSFHFDLSLDPKELITLAKNWDEEEAQLDQETIKKLDGWGPEEKASITSEQFWAAINEG